MKKETVEDKKAVMMKNFVKVHEKVLLEIEDYVRNGYVQTFANLLVYLGEDRAAVVLAELPEPVQSQVRERYNNFSYKNKEHPFIVSEVEYVLKKSCLDSKELCKKVTQGLDPTSLHLLGMETEELSKTDPVIAKSIENHLFEFKDLMKLSNRHIQKILRDIDNYTIAIALKSEDIELQEKIFSNMSKNCARLVKEEMQFTGPVSWQKIENAQSQIVDTVRELETRGDIVLFDKNSFVE